MDLRLLLGGRPADGEEEDSCGEQAGDGFHSVSFAYKYEVGLTGCPLRRTS